MVESPHYDPAKGGVERGKRGGGGTTQFVVWAELTVALCLTSVLSP